MRITRRHSVFVLALFLLGFTMSCSEKSRPVAHEAPQPPVGLTPGEHAWTTADGNTMPYVVGGKSDADVTVLFVHCWMCDRSFWDAQLPVLAERYRTVTLDLPGHGQATAERAAWTVSGYGDDVAGLIRGLDLAQVVLVGHSMGGPVSLRTAAQLPGKVLGIVAVDTLHNAEFKYDSERIEEFILAFEADFVGACNSFIERMFPEEGVEGVKAHVRDTGCDASRGDIGTALMRDFNAIDMPTWFREAGVPIRAINAAEPNKTEVEINRKYADFEAVLMEGVGHYPHITRPGEFNPLMLEAIAGLAAPRRGS